MKKYFQCKKYIDTNCVNSINIYNIQRNVKISTNQS